VLAYIDELSYNAITVGFPLTGLQ